MKTSRVRVAALGAAAALATTGAVAAASGSAAEGVPTMAHESAGHSVTSAPGHSITSTAGLRVVADPASCAHVPSGKMSSVVSFHRKASAAPTTYAVTVVSPTTQRQLQTRSVRVGPGVSTLQMVWRQQQKSVGSVSLTVKNEHGKKVATVHESSGGSPMATRCA